MGGAQALAYLVGMLRVKIVAVLLGPAGVGVIGLYQSSTSLIATVAGLGLSGSAVRAISRVQDDPVAITRTIRTMRLLCWISGLMGWAVSAALAIPLSRWMFQTAEHAWAVAALGAMVLLNTLSAGQLGVLQGLRHIGDIARVQVLAAFLNTLVTIVVYFWLREDGIVIVLIANAGITLACSWWFSRRIVLEPHPLEWRQLARETKPLVGLGVAMMWGGVLALALDLFTRSLITRLWGIEAAGIYQAAWALSGMFAGFVLAAMGTDFYPRLTAAIHDREAAIRIINEQTEIGVLLALPGLLFTLAIGKWIVWALYSASFSSAADVLVWMVLGVLGRVVSWPLGYIQLSLGASRSFMITAAAFVSIEALLVSYFVPRIGVMGAGYVFAANCFLYLGGIAFIGRRLLGFRWSPGALRLMLAGTGLVIAALLSNRLIGGALGEIFGVSIAVVGSMWCLRALAARSVFPPRIVDLISRWPIFRKMLGLV